MTDAAIREDKALELRASGKSFAAIAKTLGYERTHQANEAFNRALRRKPPAERDGLSRQELTRLDAMAEGVRAATSWDPTRSPSGSRRWSGCGPCCWRSDLP